MSTISISNSIAANTRSLNVLAGQQYEFVSGNNIVTMRNSAAAIGLEADMSIGGVSVLAAAVVSDSNRSPVKPDDVLMGPIGATDASRLFLTYLNTTGAAIIVRTIVDLDPV